MAPPRTDDALFRLVFEQPERLRTRSGVDLTPYGERLAAADFTTLQSWGGRLLHAPSLAHAFA
ncbi:MAG: hypothetical protein FJ301_14545 [Planctomycetes bacterium]|nr:hypothetical protein [Planctomycetota bacterium]